MSGHFRAVGQEPEVFYITGRDKLAKAGWLQLASSTSTPVALVTGDKSLVYFIDWEEDNEEGTRTITIREVHYEHHQLVPGPRVSRKMVDFQEAADTITNIEINADDSTPDDEVERLRDAEFERLFRAEVTARMMAVIEAMIASVMPTGRTRSVAIEGDPAKRSASEALDAAWPHDDWTGTLAQVHSLVGGPEGAYSLDSVRKALARGPYESEGEPGKPSIWRFVRR